jgi:hypothetical protein
MNARSNHVWQHWSLALPAAVLALAVAAQSAQYFREAPRPRERHLAQSVPNALPGWTDRDVPLGANEFLVGEAEKILNYDEVLNREYARSTTRLGVYVAYWGPGKMPTQLVASHTPDRCWTENGWRCLDLRFKQSGVLAGADLQPAEWRLFEPPSGGPPTYVLYWHLVDGRTYDYGERFNSIPDPIRWLRGVVAQAARGNREQYFIRLTSNEPFEELSADPGFRTVVDGLARLGLAAPGATGNTRR